MVEKYLIHDIITLEEMLAACTDFKERQNLRGALRELKGIRLDGDIPYVNQSGRKGCPVTSPKQENGKVFPKQTNYRSIDENSFLERKYNKLLEKSGSTRTRYKGGDESLGKSTGQSDFNETCVTYSTGNPGNCGVQTTSSKTHDILKARRKLFTQKNEDVSSDKFHSLISCFEKSPRENVKKQPLVKHNVDDKTVPKTSVKEILSESFMNRINEIKSTFDKHRDDRPKFRSYLYAGSLTTPTQELEDESKVTQRCVSVSVGDNKVDKNCDIDIKETVIKQKPVSLDLQESLNNADINNVSSKEDRTLKGDKPPTPRRTRRISYRTGQFSPSSQQPKISPDLNKSRLNSTDGDQTQVDAKLVRKSVLNQTDRARSVVNNQYESTVNGKFDGRNSAPAVNKSSHIKNTRMNNPSVHLESKQPSSQYRTGRQSVTDTSSCINEQKPIERKVLIRRTSSNSNMKAESSRRHTSDSTVVIQNSKNDFINELDIKDVNRFRSKSQGCTTEIIPTENKELSVQKRRMGLSRKNRVDTSDSVKSVRKYKRKDKTESDDLTSPVTHQPNIDIIMSTANREIPSKVVQSSQIRRKLPELPVFIGEQEPENDETVHERTIRLLQERRKDRLSKIIKEKEVETKSSKSKVTPEKIKDLQERLERSDSKRKACRVRRELQLLNRETQLKSPVAINLEAEFSAILKAGEAVREKENIQSPIKRSHSDIVRKSAKLEFEISSWVPDNVDKKPEVSSAVDEEVKTLMSHPLTPDSKIELIGSLMQEEAKLQEKLRRSTSFTDKRKMRAEVRQLREKRSALEDASLPPTTASLQRSASVSSGVITHASTGEGNRVAEPDCGAKQQSIEELRKQLSETTDYDEKRKIRLALRQLRQQTKDGTTQQPGLQRSQSFIHRKPSESQVKGESQSGAVPVVRSQSVSDTKGQGQVQEENIKKEDLNKNFSKPRVADSVSLVNKESLHDTKSINNKSDTNHLRRKSSSDISNKPPVPSAIRQTCNLNAKSIEAGSLPPRAPKRHSFALGNESKFVNQTKFLFEGSDKDSDSGIDKLVVNLNTKTDLKAGSNRRHSVNEGQSISSKHKPDSLEIQQNGQSNDVKFKSKFANILISGTNVERRKSTSDIISEEKTSTNSISHDSKDPIRSETTSFKVTDIEKRANKSLERPCVKTDTDSDSRLTPNIEWLEDKKRTIPTPNELDKLMSSMDIEAAFSQILDAVETVPVNADVIETQVPDSPIMEEDNESSSSSIIELTNINESKLNSDGDSFNNHKDTCDIVKETITEAESVPIKQSNEINDKFVEERKGDVNDIKNYSNKTSEDKINGAISNNGVNVKSEKTIKLSRDLSLDVSKNPDASAISVIHGDDGTVTVQEVNRTEEGDSVITEWKKVRRTQSKSEMRETDTIIEKKVTSPGGSSQTYEKDVSKTKRKITSRGSEYFSRNHYNIRKRKDLEGEEIVEHELDSESANMSVSKNESWGERSEAKVVLNRDGTTEIKPKRLSLTKHESDGKSQTDIKTSAVTAVSSGYGSVSPSDGDHDLGAVIEAHLGRPTGCPEIISPLQNENVVEGSIAVLQLTCRGHPTPTITWHKGDNQLVQGGPIRFLFDEGTGVAKLEISAVRREDLGDYKCVVKNSLGTASTSGRLTVTNKTPTLPWFQTKLDDITIMEGQSITLECQVSDVDKVMWFKDGIIQRNSPDLRQTFDGKVAKLEIIEVYLDDDGTYSCVISNKAGENGCSCRITVKESLSKDSIVPMFLRKLDAQICDVGDTAIFETEVIGSPEPIVTWYGNKVQLKQDGRHQMEYDGRIARLVLRNLSLSEGGKIECVAENSSGRISCDCVLVVQEVKRPPVLKRQLSNMTFTSGKPAVLQFEVDSGLIPNVVWRKNGLVIGQMFDFKQTFHDGTAKLEIVKACSQDSGTYDCVVKNPHGEVVTSCYLTVTDGEPNLSEPQTSGQPLKSDTPGKRLLPASFTPKIDNDRINQAKSSASKVMLVRQGSLRNMSSESQTPPSVKRAGSFHGAAVLSNKLNSPSSETTVQKGETAIRNTDIKVPVIGETSSADIQKSKDMFSDSIHKEIPHNDINVESKVNIKQLTPDSLSEKRDALNCADVNKGSDSGLEHFTRDVNSNITKAAVNNKELEDKKKALKLDIQVDSNKPTKKSETEKQNKKNYQAFEKAIAQNEQKATGPSDKSLLGRLKVGNEIRRTQSTRTPGSEKPEWLQVKLRKVTNTPLSDREKQSIEKNTSYKTPQSASSSTPSTSLSTPNTSLSNDHSNTPVKEIKLSRSQSARVVDKKTSPVLKDSTNSPNNDPARKTPIKLTPVSERAKIFLANESKSPSGKSSPTDIIAKAINLSRTESMKSPIRNRPLLVQRSGSFKTPSQSGDITLDLSPQESQGQIKEGGSGSAPKEITVWDPTAPTNIKMDYSKITDEEELNKMLSACENFEERKKLRARIKELRDIERKEWEAKRLEREKNQVDFIKEKHRQADLEKQKKLEKFAEQAKEPHELKHLEVAERNLKEKYRQADIEKQRKLEAFDRMARKEDVKETSKVTTEVSTDGKTTTTTRKVETVTSISGKGAAGRPAEEIAPQMLTQFINATSPSISGQLSVKTESWNSKDGVKRTSEKTESWGAKPTNPFKAADAANAKTNPLVAYTFAKKAATTMKRNAVTIKQEVLNFCQQNTAEYEKIEITNFSTSWNDGIAFCALIHHFYPESFDFYALDPKQRRKNFELAFDTAEKYADIAPLLDVEDMVRMKKPDWKCVFTYVQSFYRKLKDHDMNKVKSAES